MSDSFAVRPGTVPPAPTRLRRFACMMYEGVLLFGVVFLAGYLFDTLTQSRSGLMLRHARQVFLFLAIGVYFLACWRRGGQTLPMKTWNIHAVRIPALFDEFWALVLARTGSPTAARELAHRIVAEALASVCTDEPPSADPPAAAETGDPRSGGGSAILRT